MTLFPHNCEKHGHRYEGRYDLVPSIRIAPEAWGNPVSVGIMIEKSMQKIYVKDICTRCGKEIGR